MVLLCLGVVTLYVLIDLQNQALRRKAAAAVLLTMCLWPGASNAAEVQVIVPGELVAKTADGKQETRACRCGVRAGSISGAAGDKLF